MKANHCKHCPKYHCCVKICRLVFVELNRVAKPRRKHRIEIIFECEMTGTSLMKWNNCIYGAFDDE